MSTIQLSSSPPGRPRSPAAARPPKRGEFSMLPPACFRSASSSVRLCKPCHCHSQVTCKDRSIPLASHARRTRPCCGFFFHPITLCEPWTPLRGRKVKAERYRRRRAPDRTLLHEERKLFIKKKRRKKATMIGEIQVRFRWGSGCAGSQKSEERYSF